MKITELFKQKQVYSFEVFPPKRDFSISSIYKTLDGLKTLSPDFISVTYGAGGSGNFEKTLAVAKTIKQDYNIEAMAHLSCIGLNMADIDNLLAQYKEAGIENILALRGDLTPQMPISKDFKYASDLVAYIKSCGGFDICGACYPEVHVEATSRVADIKNLKIKTEAGCTHLISQLFFDNDAFYSFWERCALGGIDVPIEAGIMPAINKAQIERMVTMCGASLPKKFVTFMDKYVDNPEAMKAAGIAYAVDQIVDLLAHGVDGIHIYAMNQPEIVTKIHNAIAPLFK